MGFVYQIQGNRHLAIFILVASLLLAAAPTFSASEAVAPERERVDGEQIENIVVTGQRPAVLRQLMLEFVFEIARALANRLVEDSPRMFMPWGNTEGTTAGLAALEQFRTSDAPVRWWQITMVVDETGSPAIQLLGELNFAMVRGVASRLKSPINDAIWAGLIIVDVNRLENVRWPQLADYLAMIALAQIDPDSRPTGYDSILNLFSANSPPRSMTEIDRTYLRALYEMDTMMLPHTQRGVFSNKMVRVLLKMDEEE